jgi:hypothetical protein
MRAALARRCPGAKLIDGALGSAQLPEPVEVGLISHVYYHIPDHKWGAYTVRAAAHLADRGVLVVTLKHPDSGCNRMLEHFGAPRFDLVGSLAGAVRRHRELTFSFLRSPANYRTTTFEETLQIARFMLCDRDADAFSAAPSEEEFREYVRRHFWDERSGRGGWDVDVLYCCVRRSAFYGPAGRPQA